MVKGVTYTVFVLPVVLSFIFGTLVMAGILQEPGRELNLMQSAVEEISENEEVKIFGLRSQYSTSKPIEIQVSINDLSFSCGDLYVTIYRVGNDKSITQSGYFKQCYDSKSSFLPIDDQFSETINTPGNYELVVDMLDKDQKNSITTSAKFTVK